MNKRKLIKMSKMARKNNAVNTARLQKRLKSDYLSILDDIAKSEYNFKFDFNKFKKRITDSLIWNFRLLSDNRSKFNFELWGKKLKIEPIIKKLENIYRKKIGKKVKNITKRYENTISKIVSEGKEKGLSYSSVANNIREMVKEISVKRSYVIAVTETNTVSSQVDYDMAEEVGMKNKTWIHTGGGKTDRPTHAALDGVTIGVNEHFNVGGTLALHPHDASLPAEDVINCHCMLIYE